MRWPGWPGRRAVDERARLGTLAEAALNFDPETASGRAAGWRYDHYVVRLVDEPPGPPVPGGAFEVACEVLRRYEFADPSIVRGVFDAEAPLEGRTMLLDGRFLFLHFALGVRVGGVVDGEADIDGRRVRRFGFHYQTLQGHLEQGQMDYEIRKDLASGIVEFRIEAYSRPAHIPNAVVRLGFALFGRYMQKSFARKALERMRLLVVARATAHPEVAAEVSPSELVPDAERPAPGPAGPGAGRTDGPISG